MLETLRCLGLLGLMGWILAASANAQSVGNLEKRWAELASADEGTAARAMLALAATPKETNVFLKECLKPVKVDAKEVAKALSSLENAKFAVRNQAMLDLEYCGKFIKHDLEKALKKASTLETRRRIEQLLAKIPKAPKMQRGSSLSVENDDIMLVAKTDRNGQISIFIDGMQLDLSKAASPPPLLWMRTERAISILEHFGTQEARQLLQSLAAGEADAPPTKAARAALERLKK